MSVNRNNHGLPFLPPYTFRDVTKSAFNLQQTLTFKNGYRVLLRPTVGIGQDPLLWDQLNEQKMNELSLDTQDITDATRDRSLCKPFIPAYVALDKKVLRFFAYFVEDVLNSAEGERRVRSVVIYYYLEDDTMCIIEPTVEKSGITHSKLLKRHRFPKNVLGDHYVWKDLNLGMDLEVYCIKYHITQCDAFTKKFLESEGIVLNDPEPTPVDPVRRNFILPIQHHPN